MADEIDRANEMAELNLAASLSVRRSSLSPCGHCYYCDEPVRVGVLFCTADCRDDWQAEDKIRRIQGKK